MTARLAANIEADSIRRRIEAAGGHAMVLAKGDPQAGAILLILRERGEIRGIIGRALMTDGRYAWQRLGSQPADNEQKTSEYLDRRRNTDPDLWLIELDIAGVERFAAEMLSEG